MSNVAMYQVIFPLVKNKKWKLSRCKQLPCNCNIECHLKTTGACIYGPYRFSEWSWWIPVWLIQEGLSTGTCTHILKQAVHYYRQRGSHLFCCFVDFSKAFDNVDYWLLFCKLLDYNKCNSCLICVRLLAKIKAAIWNSFTKSLTILWLYDFRCVDFYCFIFSYF